MSPITNNFKQLTFGYIFFEQTKILETKFPKKHNICYNSP